MSVARSSGEGCGEHLVALSASARDEPPLENVLMGWVRGEREISNSC